jgi:hypothetical protein
MEGGDFSLVVRVATVCKPAIQVRFSKGTAALLLDASTQRHEHSLDEYVRCVKEFISFHCYCAWKLCCVCDVDVMTPCMKMCCVRDDDATGARRSKPTRGATPAWCWWATSVTWRTPELLVRTAAKSWLKT